MASCKMVNALYAAIPLRAFRDLLIRNHMERCERCQARLVSRSEAEVLLVKPGDPGAVERLWRKIDREALRPVPVMTSHQGGRHWEWAAGAATFFAVIATTLWLLRGVQDQVVDVDSLRPAERFEISYIYVGGAPAQAFVYQPRGSDTVFVWAGKNP